MRLKVLSDVSHYDWMCKVHGFEELGREAIQIRPRYGKPGIYLYGNQCWIELSNGLAATYSASFFRYEMKLLDVVQRYNASQIAALEQAIMQKVATKEQADIVYHWNNAMYSRGVRMRTRLHLHKDLRIPYR